MVPNAADAMRICDTQQRRRPCRRSSNGRGAIPRVSVTLVVRKSPVLGAAAMTGIRWRVWLGGGGFAVAFLLTAAITQGAKPAYKYCRVRFGDPPTIDLVLARSDDALLVYRDGDLDSKPERYPYAADRLAEGVTIPPIKTRRGVTYAITSVSEYRETKPKPRHALLLFVTVEGQATFRQYCDVELRDSPEQLKMTHFDGPLAVGLSVSNWEIPQDLKLVIGGEPADIRAIVGTVDKADGCWTVVQSGDDQFADGTHPEVTVAFPSSVAGKTIVQAYPLDQFC
jgi:hypothetical protein